MRKETLLSKFFYSFAWAYEAGDALVHFPDIMFKRFLKIDVREGDGVILELGCGTGRSSRMFSGKDVTVVNLDINKAFVAYGKKKRRLVRPVIATAYSLCFGENSFDKIIIPDAFHHILDHDLMFRECSRVLKRGGSFIIFDIVLRQNAPNRVINHFTDGTIWVLDQEGFKKKIKALADTHNFTICGFSAEKEKTVIGLLGGYDIQARLIKNSL